MKYDVENETLTLFFEGKINSYNAESVEKDVDSIVTQNSFKAVRVDLGDVIYISSAGLRIIVRLKQMYADTVLVNVPNSVYDILSMVGFQNLMKVERQ